jgi:hypothetical protein
MNITPMQMYWLVKLDDLQHAVAHLMWLPVTWITITALIVVATMVATADEEDSIRERVWRRSKKAMLLCIPMLLLTVIIPFVASLIPSTKQMAAIMIVPKIANSEKVQTIGNKVYDLAVEWMEELKPSKSEVK